MSPQELHAVNSDLHARRSELPVNPPDRAAAEAIDRLNMAAWATTVGTPIGESSPSPKRAPVDVPLSLRKAGYPERHIDALPRMRGPGLDKARTLAPAVLSGDCLILLLGDRGPGKTQMAVWLAAQRVLAGKSAGLYVKTFDLLSDIKATWSDGGRSLGTERDVLKRYRSTPFLVLDEYQERAASEWDNRCLSNILDHRYDDRRATVIIANLSVEDAKRDAIPQSVLSRARETGGIVPCEWESYR